MEEKTIADNKNVEINDEEMQNAAGGNILGLPLPKYKEGDHVIVKGWESYDSVVIEVKSYPTQLTTGWKYKVKIEKNVNGHSEYLETVMLEDELSTA